MILFYKYSPEFRDFATNHYNVRQGFKILGDKISAFGRRIKRKFGWGQDEKGEEKEDKEGEEKEDEEDEEFVDLVEDKKDTYLK